MRYTEIFADNEGVSHFRDVEMTFDSGQAATAHLHIGKSDFHRSNAGFLSVPSGWSSGWHRSPGDGYAILVKGEVEIEAGSGEVRTFKPGDVWRSHDVTGRGHVSKVISTEDAVVAMINFDDHEKDAAPA
jgi:hypothetical protein